METRLELSRLVKTYLDLDKKKKLSNAEKLFLEEIIRGINIGTQETKEKDLELFDPKNTFEYLSNFNNKDNLGFKYLTHRYDKGDFDYEERLRAAYRDYEMLNLKYKIPKKLNGKIQGFINIEWNIFTRNKILPGWKSERFKKWCKHNVGLHPINGSADLQNSISRFKKNIKIRRETLKIIFKEIIEDIKNEKNKRFNFHLDDSLESAVFFTDVDQLYTGLKFLIISSLDNSVYRDINISFTKGVENDYLTRIININFSGEIIVGDPDPKDLFSGTTSNAKIHLNGLCNWFLEAKFKSEKKIDSFSIDVFKETKIKLNHSPNGVNHKLIFYAK